MSIHVVQPGEHLSSIAADNEFENFETIWNAPENAELRANREDPNQVLEGDRVFIPDKQVASFQKPSRGLLEFQVHIAKLELRLRVLDLFGAPLKGASCTLRTDDGEIPLTTDDDGIIVASVKRDARSASLDIDGDTYDLDIGALDPPPEVSGVEGRLRNLGYLDNKQGGIDDEQQLASALEQFQANHGLEVDGTVSDSVVGALADEHGC